jgi:hypothetical protein
MLWEVSAAISLHNLILSSLVRLLTRSRRAHGVCRRWRINLIVAVDATPSLLSAGKAMQHRMSLSKSFQSN